MAIVRVDEGKWSLVNNSTLPQINCPIVRVDEGKCHINQPKFRVQSDAYQLH